MFGVNYFGILDWIVVGGTLLVSLLIGVYYAVSSKQSNEDLLVGGRNMKILPVAASIMVTYVSAITVLGFPAEVYSFGAQIFMIHVVSAIAFPLSAMMLMPFFYRMRLTSVNEYLEKRFDSIWIRWLAAATFILQQTTLSGIVLYAPSLALQAFVGLPVWLSVIGIGVCGTIYTSIGGLKAVVWTDAFQFLMMLAGMIAIVVRGVISSGGVGQAFKIAGDNGRLNFIDLTFDPFMRHNLWNFIIGSGFYALMQPAMHQLQVQRYSSMPSIGSAKKAIIYSVPLKLLVMGMCLLTGLSIFSVYSQCDPLKNGDIKKIDQIVPYFVVHELSHIPGMVGLFTACIFSAVLSSISSSLNSLAAVTWEDFLFRVKYFKQMSPSSQANVSRIIGLFYGIICMALAFGAQNLGAIYSATFAAVGATGGALFGVFILGMFFPFANAFGAVIGLLTGLVSMAFITIVAFINKKSLVPLPSSIDQCPVNNSTDSIFNNGTLGTSSVTIGPDFILEDDWYNKVFDLSYLLYAVVAAFITVTVGIIFSLVALAFCKNLRRRPNRKYLHPIVNTLCNCCLRTKRREEVSLSTGSIIQIDTKNLTYYDKSASKNGFVNKAFESSNL